MGAVRLFCRDPIDGARLELNFAAAEEAAGRPAPARMARSRRAPDEHTAVGGAMPLMAMRTAAEGAG